MKRTKMPADPNRRAKAPVDMVDAVLDRWPERALLPSRAIVGIVAVLVVLTLIVDLLTFGPASSAINPFPWVPIYIDAGPGVGLF